MSIKLITENHLEVHDKADKKYSMIPTINKIVGDVNNKKVLVLGIAEGIIANSVAKSGPKEVICYEISEEKISKSKNMIKEKNVKLKKLNYFKEKIPDADVIIIPFTINYLGKQEEVNNFLKKIYKSLSAKGKIVGIIDLPERAGKIKLYGSLKKVKGKLEDEAPIQIELYKHDKLVGELITYYYSQPTVKTILKETGFSKIIWVQPEISQEGITKYGNNFWKDYTQNPGLGYFWAQKA